MNIFARSWQGLNLSPGERAFVKLAEGWLITALLAGSAIVYQLLMSGNADYAFILRSAGGAALLSALLAFKKYLAAQSDLPLPTASLATQATDVAIMEAQKIVPQPQPAQAPQPVPPMTDRPQASAPFAGLPPVPQQPFPAKQDTFEIPVARVQQ
jgi:hypothetical protein